MSPKIIRRPPTETISDNENRSPGDIKPSYAGGLFSFQRRELIWDILIALLTGIILGAATSSFVHHLHFR